jgi:hypothetical protein
MSLAVIIVITVGVLIVARIAWAARQNWAERRRREGIPDSGLRVTTWRQWTLLEKLQFGLPMLIMLALSVWGLAMGYWIMGVFLVIVAMSVGYVLLAKVPQRLR